LVVAEAWSAGTPVVVNAACAATVEHCRRSGGGLTFAGYGEFEVAVDLLSGDGRVRTELAGRGRAYVDRWFRWPRVIDRYATFVENVVASAS
jgi:glycosyltransferase involved in cell wall biosynthesis